MLRLLGMFFCGVGYAVSVAAVEPCAYPQVGAIHWLENTDDFSTLLARRDKDRACSAWRYERVMRLLHAQGDRSGNCIVVSGYPGNLHDAVPSSATKEMWAEVGLGCPAEWHLSFPEYLKKVR